MPPDMPALTPEGYLARTRLLEMLTFISTEIHRAFKPLWHGAGEAEKQQAIASQPYLTRLFTTLDPDEMTLDTFVTFNLDLGDVSNVHEVQGFVECGVGGDYDA